MYINAKELQSAIATIAHIPLIPTEDLKEINDPQYLIRGNLGDKVLMLTVMNDHEAGFVRINASEPDDDDPSSMSDGNEFVVSFADFNEAVQDCMGDIELVVRSGDLAVIYKGTREWVLKQPISFPSLPFPPTPNLTVPTAELITALEQFGDEHVWLYIEDSQLKICGKTTAPISKERHKDATRIKWKLNTSGMTTAGVYFDVFQPSLDRTVDPYSLVTASVLLDAIKPHSQQPIVKLSIDHQKETVVYLTVQGCNSVIQGVAGVSFKGKKPPHHITEEVKPREKKKRAAHLSVVPDPEPIPEPVSTPALAVPEWVLKVKTDLEHCLEEIDRLSEAGDEALFLITIQSLKDSINSIPQLGGSLARTSSKPKKPKAKAAAKSKPKTTEKKTKVKPTSDRTPVIPSEKFAEIEEMFTLKKTMTASAIADIFTERGRPMGDTTVSQYIATYKMLMNSETAKNLFLSGQVRWSDVYAMSRKVNQWGITKIEEYLLDKAKQSA